MVGKSVDDIPPVESFDKNKQNLVLIDDMMGEDQTNIFPLMYAGRHHNVSTILITQSYYKTPRLIRLQLTNICLFEAPKREILSIYQDLGNNCDGKEFEKMLMDCTTEDFGFLVVDKRNRDKRLQYRRGFDRFVNGDYIDLDEL